MKEATYHALRKVAPSLTRDDFTRLSMLLNTTWQYIGSDYLALNEGIAIPRGEVIEVTLDAGRLEDNARTPYEKELVKRFRLLDYVQQIAVAEAAFPFMRYGY